MFNHKDYVNKFIADYQKGILNNNSQLVIKKGVGDPSTGPSTSSGDTSGHGSFKIIGIHKLTSVENVGKHNLFIEVLDEKGVRVKNTLISWGWEGQLPNQQSRPILLDKPASEPYGNIAIWANQTIWATVKSSNPCDTVENVHTRLPDEGSGNTYGHHSFLVVWQLTAKVPELPPPTEEANEAEKVLEKIYNLVGNYFEQRIK